MTHVIIAVDGNTYIHKESPKSPDELCREIQLGCFESPIGMNDPTAVRLQNYLLVAEREEKPLLSRRQMNLLELLSHGADEYELEKSLRLTQSGVRYHMDELKRKFNVRTRNELVSAYCRMFRH